MPEPHASRPLMPGYGVVAADQGSGLLPWSWALERLRASRNYWLATVWPDGRPHAMPVWGVWDAGHLWFSRSLWAFGLESADFTGSPTRWVFGGEGSPPVA